MNEPVLSPYRQQLVDLLTLLPDRPLIGAEIGVHNGASSYWMLKSTPRLTLHLVDPWTTHDAETEYRQSGDPVASQTRQEVERVRLTAMRRTEEFRDRVVVHRTCSLDAVTMFDNGELDFVFIDAQHQYAAVYADWSAWWPKVKPGGILCGHDYGNDNSAATAEVKSAVDDWALIDDVRLNVGVGFVAWCWK